MAQRQIAARPVGHLGGQQGVRHLRHDPDRGADEQVQPLHQLRRGQDGTGRLIQPEELDHVADVLGEDPVVAARQDGHGARAEAAQFRKSVGVGQHVDGY